MRRSERIQRKLAALHSQEKKSEEQQTDSQAAIHKEKKSFYYKHYKILLIIPKMTFKSLYNTFRLYLPTKIQIALSKFVFKILNKPINYDDNFIKRDIYDDSETNFIINITLDEYQQL